MDNLFEALARGGQASGERYLTAILAFLLRHHSVFQKAFSKCVAETVGAEVLRPPFSGVYVEERSESGDVPDLRVQTDGALAFIEVKVWADLTDRQRCGQYLDSLRNEAKKRKTQLLIFLVPASQEDKLSPDVDKLRTIAKQSGPTGCEILVLSWEKIIEFMVTESESAVESYLATQAREYVRREISMMDPISRGELNRLTTGAGDADVAVALLRLVQLLDAIRREFGLQTLYFDPNPVGGRGPYVSIGLEPVWNLRGREGECGIGLCVDFSGKILFEWGLYDGPVAELRRLRSVDRVRAMGYEEDRGNLIYPLARHIPDAASLQEQGAAVARIVRDQIATISQVLGRRVDRRFLPGVTPRKPEH